jgi:hypothetical protein
MHPFKRAFLIVLFGLGTVGGFAHGFASLGHCANSCRSARRASFEDHVAEVCTRAAERVADERAAVNPPVDPRFVPPVPMGYGGMPGHAGPHGACDHRP